MHTFNNKEAHYLHIAIPYDKEDESITFDDGMMTELECEEDFTPPMLNTDSLLLEFVIDLKERKIINRNEENGYVRMWAKVRDSGTYTLLDEKKEPICQICGYVPNKLIPPFEKGFGDYIELAIDADGTVRDWPETPDFSEFMEQGKTPESVKSNKWHRAEDALEHICSMNLCKDEIAWLVERLQEIDNPN